MTRARAGGTGEEEFGHSSRAYVRWVVIGWRGYRVWDAEGEDFDTWAEAMAYALEEDETDDH